MHHRLLLASLAGAILLSGCDAAGPSARESVGSYRTDGTDEAFAAVLIDGALVLGGLTEGRIAPADGTIGLPLVVRFGADGAPRATVDRSAEASFAGIEGVAPWSGGLALARRTDEGPQVVAADDAGRAGRVLFQGPPDAFLVRDALVRTADRLAVVVSGRPEATHVYALGPDGALAWAFHLDGAQRVDDLAVGPDGSLFAAGPSDDGLGVRLARVGPDGATLWTRSVEGFYGEMGASAAGATVGVTSYGGPEGRGMQTIRLHAFAPDGTERWTRLVSEASVEGVTPGLTALAMDPGGTVYAALREGSAFGSPGATARVVTLGADGAERARVRVGPERRFVSVSHVLPRADGAPLVVTTVGPRYLNGYGGDDLDIVVFELAR